MRLLLSSSSRGASGLAQIGQYLGGFATKVPCQKGVCMSIALVTFDIFGTVLDWRTALEQALGEPLEDGDFDAVIDRQGELDTEQFRPYTEIVAQSLVDELGLLEPDALR